jgi:hypothetical protein
MSKNKKEACLWVIYGEEEQPVGIALAKTMGGALKVYEDRTGLSRYGLHAQKMMFKNNCFKFVSAI